MTDAAPANAASDFKQIGYFMGQLRTANKRRNRAILLLQARTKAAKAEAPVAAAKAAS